MKMTRIFLYIFSVVIASGSIASAELTAREIEQIESEFGITLTTNQIQELDAVVNPTNSAPWRTDAEARIDQVSQI